ncbi:exported hypothetical protein [Gammaproteobacteria bacterium]
MPNLHCFVRKLVNGIGVTFLSSALITGLPASAAGLNDTGINTCSDFVYNELACPVTGLEGQDAEYGTNHFDFTKLDASGNDLWVTASTHVCVRDNVTKLIWEVKTDDHSLRDKGWTYTWYDSGAPGGNPGVGNGGNCHDTSRCDTEKYVQDVNAAGLCGFKDWRMPTVKELTGIVDFSRQDSIDPGYFPNTPSSRFWSSTPHASYSDGAWYVSFDLGYVSSESRTTAYPVRLVRGAKTVDSFVDNGNGTVSDNNTGLMWAKCCEGLSGAGCATGSATPLEGTPAMSAARNSTLAGYDDWHMPNVKELQSLVDYGVSSPSINSTFFPNFPSDVVWSNSPAVDANYGVWGVTFGDGAVGSGGRTAANAVCLVRGTGGTNDVLTLQSNSPSIVGTGAGNDTYVLAPNTLTSTTNLTLSDTQGSNVLQLVAGLSITKSEVAATAIRLTLDNGGKVTLLGADAFNFIVGGNTTPMTYAAFSQNILKVTVPTTGIVIGGPVTITNP